MKKVMLEIFSILLIGSFLSGQQGEYQRKSVSSIESVWIKQGALQGGIEFDYAFFDKMVDFYIEMDRFDYNVLPASMLSLFRNEANSLEELTPDAIGEVLERTVGAEILKILNSDDIKASRGLELKDESAYQSFAATKAKSLGLTVEELETLMNSAYIYLPYISLMKQKIEGNNITVELYGGIIWYRMQVDESFDYSIKRMVAENTSGIGTATKGARSKFTGNLLYDEFKFGSETFSTTEEQYAQYDAILAWAKNLGVKTKQIEDFRLQAQIVEAIRGKYGFPLGFKEGVHLDDGFFLVEWQEDEYGNEISVSEGFVRVIKTGDNRGGQVEYTYATQLLGRQQDIGGTVMEHPRLGIDARFKLNYVTGLNIPKEYTQFILLSNEVQVLAEDATSALLADFSFGYNLAPIIGITQTFLDLALSFGVPLAPYTEEAIVGQTVAFIFSGYMGASKKFWFGRSNIGAGAGFGLDALAIRGTFFQEPFVYSIRALGINLSGDYEYLINQDLSLNVGVGMKIGFPPMQVGLTWAGEEIWTYTGAEVTELYPELFLGGWSLRLGVNYSLGELPINLFGFLDPLKKY